MTGSLNVIGYGIAAIGPAIATGMIFAAYISGVARQPESRSVLQPIAFLGFAMARSSRTLRPRTRIRSLIDYLYTPILVTI